MSVLLETSLGDIVIDLYCDKAPLTTKNFLKLCKMKFYNGTLFYDVQRDYLARVMHADKPPTSIYEMIGGPKEKNFTDEINPGLKHDKFGTVSTANVGPNLNDSNFFMTLSYDHIQSLDNKHTIFGYISEGADVLQKINESYVDSNNRPYTNIRILHTTILDDPFQDPTGLSYPDESPQIIFDSKDRLDFNDKIELLEDKGRTEEEIIEATKEHEAKTKAIVLEMLNDLPDADIKPPDNVLFVCKLNPVTQEKDLELIFSRFGPIKTCDIIRDWKTGQSLQYAFIEFETPAACEEAYFKMENALIDERRIHVDFSQSVAKYWGPYKNSKMGKKGGPGQNSEPGDRPSIQLKNELMRRDDRYQMVFDEEQGGPAPNKPKERDNGKPRERDNGKPRERDNGNKYEKQPKETDGRKPRQSPPRGSKRSPARRDQRGSPRRDRQDSLPRKEQKESPRRQRKDSPRRDRSPKRSRKDSPKRESPLRTRRDSPRREKRRESPKKDERRAKNRSRSRSRSKERAVANKRRSSRDRERSNRDRKRSNSRTRSSPRQSNNRRKDDKNKSAERTRKGAKRPQQKQSKRKQSSSSERSSSGGSDSASGSNSGSSSSSSDSE